MPSSCEVVESRGSEWVCMECGLDIGVEFVNIHNDCCAEDWEVQRSCSEGGHKLFGGEYRSEIVWIYGSVIPFSLLKVDVHCQVRESSLVPSHPGWNRMMRLCFGTR